MALNRPLKTVLGGPVLATTLLATLVFLAGCSAATPTKKVEEPKEPATPSKPMPTLLGTWQRATIDRTDDGDITETITLTFTDAHFIERFEATNENGMVIGTGGEAGNVSITETSVLKTWVVHDEDESGGSEVSVSKEYLLVGDALFIHHWGSDRPEENFDRFARVADVPMSGGPTSLLGTWANIVVWDDEGHWDRIVRENRTLTLTRERYIEDRRLWDVATGGVLDDGDDVGTWSATETSFTKTFIEDDAEHSVPKRYILTGNFLAIEPWWADEPHHELRVYVRVQDPIPGGIAGTWTHSDTREHDELGTGEQTLTYTITADTFTEIDQTVYESGDVEIATISGNLTINRETQHLMVAVTDAQETWNGEPSEDFDPMAQFVGRGLRYGYAASSLLDKVRFSPRWDELEWNDETMMWMDHEHTPYGAYWRLFTRSQQAAQ